MERRARDPDTGEITYGSGLWQKIVTRLTGKTTSKLASKAAEKLAEKGAENVGDKTGEVLGEKIYGKFSNRKKPMHTEETKGKKLERFCKKKALKILSSRSKTFTTMSSEK